MSDVKAKEKLACGLKNNKEFGKKNFRQSIRKSQNFDLISQLKLRLDPFT